MSFSSILNGAEGQFEYKKNFNNRSQIALYLDMVEEEKFEASETSGMSIHV